MISKKYIILEKIGYGRFGSVFKGKNIRTNEFVAIKMTSIKDETNVLTHEAKIYNILGCLECFPKFKWYGRDNDNYYLVMNLLGDSLHTFKTKYHRLSDVFVRNIANQMILRLKTYHEKGFIHRDIKPSNFVFGINNEYQTVILIDYGFSKGYMHNNVHMPMKKTTNIIGTLNYISLNVHKKNEPSRRDDLESVCYILLYLLDCLYWDKYTDPSVSNILKIISEKESIIHCKHIPSYITNMIQYIRNLDFEETPDYSLLMKYISE